MGDQWLKLTIHLAAMASLPRLQPPPFTHGNHYFALEKEPIDPQTVVANYQFFIYIIRIWSIALIEYVNLSLSNLDQIKLSLRPFIYKKHHLTPLKTNTI